jgi:DNA polymerase-3 subunit gamma/tau
VAYQSLYRRYRSQRWSELKGQDHVSQTLRNAVREGRVSHAYLFSGPRGTGKTSSARILAKALNCSNPDDGEPCGTCESCVGITEGRSLDVVELDAASNRGVDAMRELVSRAALGTPGRWKVYIVDEVHMLTNDASTTLLKTLEEPPGHVIFVLATTEPQKVLPTIRSRTQHFEFRLLPLDLLTQHLKWVAADAGLDVPAEVIDLVARRGKGSVRDALSVLDQVAAAGGIDHHAPSVGAFVEALCERDAGAALAAVAERCGAGHDPRQIATDVLERLRQTLLVSVSRALVGLPDEELDAVEAEAHRLGRPATVRAMEVLGETLVDMREAPDPRILLEVALVRLCRPELDSSPAALLERIERLERALAGRPPAPAAPSAPAPAPAAAPPVAAPPPAAAAPPPPAPAAASGAAGARLALGGVRSAAKPLSGPPPAAAASAPPPVPPARPPRPPAGASPPAGTPLPSRDELTLAWGDKVLMSLSPRAKSRFRVGRFVASEGDRATFALPNAIHRDRCEEVRVDVEQALEAHFGRPVPLRLVTEDPGAGGPPGAGPAPAGGPPPDDEPIDLDDLQEAPPSEVRSPVDHVLSAFEGATVVEE